MSDTNKDKGVGKFPYEDRLYLVAGKHIEGRESVLVTGDLNVFTKEKGNAAANHHREKRLEGEVIEVTSKEYSEWAESEQGKSTLNAESEKLKAIEAKRKKVSAAAVARKKAKKRY